MNPCVLDCCLFAVRADELDQARRGAESLRRLYAPLGAGEDETHPMLIAGIGFAMLFLVPLVWGLLRKGQGLPMFGAPTVAQLDDDPRYVGSRAWH